MFIEEGPALGKSLGMGEDGIDVFQFRPRKGEKVMLDFHDLFSHHGTVIPPDKIVHFGDSAGGRVFDRDYPVIDIPFFYCLHDVFKEGEIGFFPRLIAKLLLHGFVGIGPFGAIAAYP